MHKFHSLNVVTCFLLCRRFSFSHPTRSLSLSFPSPFSHSSTQVCLTQVCHGQVSTCTFSASSKSSSYLQAILQVSRLYSQTHSLEARLWQSEVKRGCGKVKSPPFPHYQKESVACLLLIYRNSTLFTHGS